MNLDLEAHKDSASAGKEGLRELENAKDGREELKDDEKSRGKEAIGKERALAFMVCHLLIDPLFTCFFTFLTNCVIDSSTPLLACLIDSWSKSELF